MKRLFDFSSRFKILKGGKISLVVSAMIGSTTLSFAAPSGGVVTSGSASISQSGNITNIVQDSQKASINWKDFSINKDEIVNFKQPNVNSITLNRVIGNEKSIINGALNANGQVWILNSNGVLFGKNAKINTAGLLATTKELSDQDFQAGNFTFKGDSSQSVINLGEIDISDSGYATLLANSVSNEGVIKAIKGSVRLVGAKEVTINFNGNSLVDLTVNKGVLDSLVENKGAVYADGGEIYFTTNAVNELLKGVVNNEGIAEANSLDGITGHIEMFAHGGEAKISGEITAKDGFVETSAKRVDIDSNTKVKADKWLIDPTNITIDDSTAYETSLNSGTDVEIQTDSNGNEEGNIYVEDEITWDSGNKLTLNAHNDIFINKSITATNENGKLALHYGQGNVSENNTSDYHINAKVNLKEGDNFFTKQGSDGEQTTWTVITKLGTEGSTSGTDLQGIQGDLSANYVLGTDIDASNTLTWNNGAGFQELGKFNRNSGFLGNFDGLGHTISNLTLNRPTTPYQALFGFLSRGSTVSNVNLTNANIFGGDYVAGIAGISEGVIKKSFVSGNVTASGSYAGGLVGSLWYVGNIFDSHAEVNIVGDKIIGGLAGDSSLKTVINSYYNANRVTINGKRNVITRYGIYENQYNDWINNGSLNISDYFTLNNGVYEINNLTDLKNILPFSNIEGINFKLMNNIDLSSVENFYIPVLYANFNGNNKVVSNLNISQPANSFIGFFGFVFQSVINNLRIENVSILGDENVGSIAGYSSEGSISGVYATGSISAKDNYLGGLVGSNYMGTITKSYSDVKVSGEEGFVGGLVGLDYYGSISGSYAKGNVSGTNYIGGLIGSSYRSTISNSYAKGNVSGNDFIGGLVGYLGTADIFNSYVIGNVSGNDYIGGLVGYSNRGNIFNSYYDRTINQGMNDETSGKTTIELQDKTTYKNGSEYDWSIIEDSTIVKGTPILSWQVGKDGENLPIWLLGTKVVSQSTEKLDKVITTIANKEVIKINVPVLNNKTPLNSGKNVDISFNLGENKAIVSKPIEGQTTKRVTLSQAKQMQQDATGQNVEEVKVPLSRSSIIELVDGGVSLPTGVEQEFYIADEI